MENQVALRECLLLALTALAAGAWLVSAVLPVGNAGDVALALVVRNLLEALAVVLAPSTGANGSSKSSNSDVGDSA